MSKIETLAMNTVRTLSVDEVQAANSGHPGLPLGASPMAYSLWAKGMKHNPHHPEWENRDRFVLSAGHGSAMLYALLHLFDYGVSLDDLKQFRQWGSKTPGHPEYRHTKGVEITTGPLGSGLASAVGMAMAEAHLAAQYNRPGFDIVDHYTFVIVGDGCLQEGVSAEASSLAGTLKLSKLIVLYDSNNITIEGNTSLSFREDVRARYQAYGFDTDFVSDGNDTAAILSAIERAKKTDKPSFIEIKTEIGYGSVKAGTAGVHGEPLGAENVIKLKEFLDYPSTEPFYVDPSVYAHMKDVVRELGQTEEAWKSLLADYEAAYPDLAKAYHSGFAAVDTTALLQDVSFWSFDEKAQATRVWSGLVLNRLGEKFPQLFGGSADLAPSNKSNLTKEGSFSAEDYSGRNIHFGIRENAMAAIGNGLAVHGGVIPYVATFFVFADYLKGMARLSAIEGVPLIYVLTHDSIGVGEDGPTHEPIEQLSMLRATPNTHVYRPADSIETAAAYVSALSQKTTPTVLALSRQNCDVIPSDKIGALKGGYVISKAASSASEYVLIATGSEVSLALKAQAALAEIGIDASVVSMPSQEVFNAQSPEYQESVLPKHATKRLAIEAGASQSWYRYVGTDGKVLGIDHFGASAPADRIFKEFGFTIENIVELVKGL